MPVAILPVNLPSVPEVLHRAGHASDIVPNKPLRQALPIKQHFPVPLVNVFSQRFLDFADQGESHMIVHSAVDSEIRQPSEMIPSISPTGPRQSAPSSESAI